MPKKGRLLPRKYHNREALKEFVLDKTIEGVLLGMGLAVGTIAAYFILDKLNVKAHNPTM